MLVRGTVSGKFCDQDDLWVQPAKLFVSKNSRVLAFFKDSAHMSSGFKDIQSVVWVPRGLITDKRQFSPGLPPFTDDEAGFPLSFAEAADAAGARRGALLGSAFAWSESIDKHNADMSNKILLQNTCQVSKTHKMNEKDACSQPSLCDMPVSGEIQPQNNQIQQKLGQKSRSNSGKSLPFANKPYLFNSNHAPMELCAMQRRDATVSLSAGCHHDKAVDTVALRLWVCDNLRWQDLSRRTEFQQEPKETPIASTQVQQVSRKCFLSFLRTYFRKISQKKVKSETTEHAPSTVLTFWGSTDFAQKCYFWLFLLSQPELGNHVKRQIGT